MNSVFLKGYGEVSIRMLDEKLMYEEEIPPGVCRHIIKTLRESAENKIFMEKMLKVLYELPFNNKCNTADHHFETIIKLR